jgi:glutamine synthetase
MTPKEAVAFAKKNNAVAADLKFLDFVGIWQHFTIPMSEFDEALFEDGSGFDGSSIRGWQPINASDMLVVPDPTTIRMDPFCAEPTVHAICNVVDPITKEDYSRDPRNIARKAEAYLKSTGIGETAYFGPEPEFFILDEVRYDTNQSESYFHIDSTEARWNTGKNVRGEAGANLGYKVRNKEGYFPVPPSDSQQDIRTEMCRGSRE